jgi:hypothetical protein
MLLGVEIGEARVGSLVCCFCGKRGAGIPCKVMECAARFHGVCLMKAIGLEVKDVKRCERLCKHPDEKHSLACFAHLSEMKHLIKIEKQLSFDKKFT